MNKEEDIKSKNQPRITVSISDEVEKGIYVNQAIIGHSQKEFVIDLGFLAPPGNKIKVQARVITNPVDAKILYLFLKENIEKYEERFGAIPVQVQKMPPRPDGSSPIH
ncbi:MAG: DUF3467 domain-containing protein [bacterium]